MSLSDNPEFSSKGSQTESFEIELNDVSFEYYILEERITQKKAA